MEENLNSIAITRIIDSAPDDEYICPLCKQIFILPVACSQCESHYCEYCITKYLKVMNNNRCPQNECDFTIKKPSSILIKFLNKLKVKCENYKFGCKEEHMYGNIINHQENCLFISDKCIGCKNYFLKSNIIKHMGDCEMVEEDCKICGKIMTKKDIKTHEILECMKKKLIDLDKENKQKNVEILDLKSQISNKEDKINNLTYELKKSNNSIIAIKTEINNIIDKISFLEILNSKNYKNKEITINEYKSWAIGGYMFDIEAKIDLILNQIGCMSRESGSYKIALYYKMGTFEGYEESENDWKILYDSKDNLNFIKQQVLIIPCEFSIFVQKNSRLSFYIANNENVGTQGEMIGKQNNDIPYKDLEDIKIYNGSFHARNNKRFKLYGQGYIKNVGFLGCIKYKTSY